MQSYGVQHFEMSIFLTSHNCIEHKKKHRCSGEVSVHVLDLIESTMYSARTNKPKKIDTTCKIPKIFTAKEINKIMR